MSFNFLGSWGLGTQNTNSLLGTSQSAQFQQNFQQNLQQLEQTASTNPQAAIQLLQSLPPGERHGLMQALQSQDPQAAQSIQSEFQQLEAQQSQLPSQGQFNLSSMVGLASTIGKMLGSSNGQGSSAKQLSTGPSGGYSAITTMEA